MKYNIKSGILKEGYILYCFTYLVFYIHSRKSKVINLVGEIENVQKDIVLYIILVAYICAFFLNYLNNTVDNRKSSNNKFLVIWRQRIFYGFYLLLFLTLVIYGQMNYRFTNLKIYIWESVFFYFFGAVGLLLPLLMWNQLFFLMGLFSMFCVGKILFYIGYNPQLLLGSLGYFSLKQWVFLFLTLVVYIITTVGLDLLNAVKINSKEQQNEETPVEEVENNQQESLKNHQQESLKNHQQESLKINKKIASPVVFTEEIIDTIYDTKNEEDAVCQITENIDQLGEKLIKILGNFSIQGEMYKQLTSYTVSNYFFKPQAGTKMSRIESIEEELSMEIGRNIRVTSSLQGVIFEVANAKNIAFSFKDIWEQCPTEELPLFIGFDSLGTRVVLDLAKQPHILMCGTTGSGKSSTLQCLIHSLITSKPLDSFQFIFIDPKVLELSVYKALPNLFCPIVTNLDNAAQVLVRLVEEMENRYKIIATANQRSIKEYNRKMTKTPLLYLVCVIEEFADLALHKNNNFKNSVQRLAQMGRAAGIHLIIATQRPSVNVIDGVIKANFPTRIGLKVANKMESRIILDQSGAERMSGPGEMILLDASGLAKRVVAPYISEEEIERLMAYIRAY